MPPGLAAAKARDWPSGAQSALATASFNSRGEPPVRGRRARVPSSKFAKYWTWLRVIASSSCLETARMPLFFGPSSRDWGSIGTRGVELEGLVTERGAVYDSLAIGREARRVNMAAAECEPGENWRCRPEGRMACPKSCHCRQHQHWNRDEHRSAKAGGTRQAGICHQFGRGAERRQAFQIKG